MDLKDLLIDMVVVFCLTFLTCTAILATYKYKHYQCQTPTTNAILVRR